MLGEDIIKTFWIGNYPNPFNDPLTCKIDGQQCTYLSGIAMHMKKAHKIYMVKNKGRKRELYHTHDLRPQENSEDWFVRLPENKTYVK